MRSMLAIREVAPYMLRRNLISAEAVVTGDLLVVDATHRNCNYKVISRHSPGYLLKQGIGPAGEAMVAREASVYQFLEARPEARRLRRYLPRYYEYDPSTGVLILELLRDAESLSALYRRRGCFSAALAAEIGGALGALHHLPVFEESGSDRKQPTSPPWILSIHRPPLGLFREISSANIRLIELIQDSPEFCQLLDELRHGWQRNALIHYDIKGENVVAFAPGNARRKTHVALIDWESARTGDAGWDVASVFSDYLSFWLQSIPITGEEPPEHFLELARYPLENMQPAIRAFWHAYIRRMEFDGVAAHQVLLRSVRYSAARLVQTGYEHQQMATQLTGNIIGLLQLSLNILQRPLEASVHLLGISLTQARMA